MTTAPTGNLRLVNVRKGEIHHLLRVLVLRAGCQDSIGLSVLNGGRIEGNPPCWTVTTSCRIPARCSILIPLSDARRACRLAEVAAWQGLLSEGDGETPYDYNQWHKVGLGRSG